MTVEPSSDLKTTTLNHFEGDFCTFYERYVTNASKIGRNEYKALCPFHKETNPSFNFNRETGLYYCHGCDKGGDFIDFYARINSLDIERDFVKILQGIATDFNITIKDTWNPDKGQIITTYDYKDESGNILFQVCRLEPKGFTQRKPDGKGGWINNTLGVRRVLYRLPEVIKDQKIFIVEGEKDSDNLHSLGFTTTCNPGGAGKWLPEYSESLRGKEVVLIPDNDPPGREHMTKVARSLQGIAASIKWFELPDLPEKGDISDWLEFYRNDKEALAERLNIMIADIPEYKPPKNPSIKDAILRASEFQSRPIEPRRSYLHPWLREQSIVLVSGFRGIGKSWFGLQVLIAVAIGKQFGPWQSESPVPCLYLDGEMPCSDTSERLKMLQASNDCDLHIYSEDYANELGLPRAHLGNSEWRDEMKLVLIDLGIRVWVVDNIASLASGLDENAKKDWDPINAWLLELRFSNISTILLHHVGKEGHQRGTSAREDNIDISILLKQPHDYSPEDGCRFIPQFTKARISHKDLPLLGDIEFKLIEDSGHYAWQWGNVKKEIKRECLRMLTEGSDYDSICSVLGISKGYITKMKKQFIRDGMLSSIMKLTPDGKMFIA